MTNGFGSLRAAVFGGVWLCILASGWAIAQPAPGDEGLHVYKSANCVGCHKWSGNGGGGYGGAAANLRETKLSLDQIEETIRCGRPMAGMPHFQSDAYADGHCYGLTAADLADGKMPPEPDHFLRPGDVEAVAEYVVTQIKGKGEPTFAQCQAFFGSGTRVCDVYAKQNEAGQNEAGKQEVSASGESTPHAHLQVEAAPDANAPHDTRK
ncbi:MAG TPA: c-type cytochrome [Rhodopila sp.]